MAERYGNVAPDKAAKLSLAQARKTLQEDVLHRADYELEVIESMDFSHYFLIVWDFCNWGKQNQIFFGPGRGSAAGSIISYSLNITTVDPFKV